MLNAPDLIYRRGEETVYIERFYSGWSGGPGIDQRITHMIGKTKHRHHEHHTGLREVGEFTARLQEILEDNGFSQCNPEDGEWPLR